MFLSPLLVLLCVEIWSLKIRADPEMEGLSFHTYGSVSSSIIVFTILWRHYINSKTEESLQRALNIIDDFFKVFGLKLNKAKSIAIGKGSTNDIKGNPGNLIWKRTNELMKILGIYFNSSKEP